MKDTTEFGSKRRVGFILSQFPCYDETFLMREMSALREIGLEFNIFSLKPCRDSIVHKNAEELRNCVIQRPLFLSFDVMTCTLNTVVFSPIKAFGALFEHVTNCWRSVDFLLKGLALFPLACFVARESTKNGIGLVHGQWATHPASVALMVNRLSGIPCSFTGHAHDIYVNQTGLAHKLRRAEFVLTCTADNKEFLTSIGGRDMNDRILVCYHGLDLKNSFCPVDGKDGKENGSRLNIVSVGSLLPCKGYDLLLDACKILSEREVPFHLTIVGGGRLEEELIEYAENLGLISFVSFAGYVTEDMMPQYYQEADCFVLASRPEIHWGIPNVVVEAMACELPVITTSLPSLSELIDDRENGYLLPSPDPAVIADVLEELNAHPDRLQHIGREARKRVMEMFDIEENAMKLARLFAEGQL